MEINAGWLEGVSTVPSPNCDERPPGQPISLLVLHNISLPPGEFGGGHVIDFFTNSLAVDRHPFFATIADLKVSSHLFIDREGGLVQFVSFSDRAWHAGESCFAGRQRCNDFSIGIELEGTDTVPYTGRQYDVLLEVTSTLMKTYPGITTQSIVGHRDIAPRRKTDPGTAFDWHEFLGRLTAGAGT